MKKIVPKNQRLIYCNLTVIHNYFISQFNVDNYFCNQDVDIGIFLGNVRGE